MENTKATEVEQEGVPISFAEFLEATPPSMFVKLSNLVREKPAPSGYGRRFALIKPEIQLHCPSDSCNGIRFFRCTSQDEVEISSNRHNHLYIAYMCSNCRSTVKTFSLAVKCDGYTDSGIGFKFGELPVYGPPTPARLIQLIGPDRDIFLKGRRCENQGLGIGAFVYYRRVVENQKNRIIEEIIKVSKKLNLDISLITALEAAKAEVQFTKALESVKNAIPQVLLINGHNPLTLLHSALSEGLHEQSDQECLEVASSVRIVLAELSERLAQVLKDEAELNHALSRLMGKRGNS